MGNTRLGHHTDSIYYFCEIFLKKLDFGVDKWGGFWVLGLKDLSVDRFW